MISFFVFEILLFKNLHFSTSGTRVQSNFGFYVLLFINFFDQDVNLYVFGGKEFKNAVRFDELKTEKKLGVKNMLQVPNLRITS